jgi:hypothetical protein
MAPRVAARRGLAMAKSMISRKKDTPDETSIAKEEATADPLCLSIAALNSMEHSVRKWTASYPLFFFNVSYGVSGFFWRIGARMQD